jgi:hypothetical protein
MLHVISIFVQPRRKSFVRFAEAVLLVLTVACSPAPIFAQQAGAEDFRLRRGSESRSL